MALTLETTVAVNAIPVANGGLPSGYSVPSTTITFAGETVKKSIVVDLASAGISEAANQVTAMTALVAAAGAYVSATAVPDTLGLDTSLNLNMIATVNKVVRQNSNEETILLTGTDQYQVTIAIEYEVV